MQGQKRKEFAVGLLWNYGSIFFLAVGGFVFSFIIILFYDANILGIFNRIYAYYLLLSQLSVFGVHMSVTKYVSDQGEESETSKCEFASGMMAATAISVGVSAVAWLVIMVMEQRSDSVILNGMWTVIPGLVFFSLNKVMLGYLNGLSRMKAYAVVQSLRNVFIALALSFLAIIRTNGLLLPLSFSIAEILLFFGTAIYLQRQHLWGGKIKLDKMKEHIRFGFFILPGNLILEFNSKIDIICLGWILKDNTLIGYYSFASLFTEGFYQLFVVVRRSINPLLARYYSQGDIQNHWKRLTQKVKKYTLICSLPAACLLVAGYAVLCKIMQREEYLAALIPLAVIAASMAINSKYIVFGNLLSQTGNPAQESIVNTLAAASNMLLNLIFISWWGMLGAAYATATSYFVFSVLLHHLTQKKLKLKL